MAKQRVALVCVPLTLVGLYLLNIGSPSSQADAAPAGRGGKWRGRGGRGRGGRHRQELMDAAVASLVASPPPPAGACGDGRCEAPETPDNCMADCPGVTTPPQCGEEPHSDVGGSAVVWGASHKKDSAAQCCDACAAHAADPKNARKPCNSWVFCYTYPQCWSLDTGNWHGYGECWLKHQTDPKNPLYGQRGAFTDEFRRKHANAHKTGRNPDGTRRNLSVPTHVPWTAGVMYAGRPPVDLSVKWFTGPEGMTSSTGASTVMWRAWESREQNLARGVDPATMPK